VKPEILLPYLPGTQNEDLEKANARLTAGKTYQDLSTVIVVPTRGGRSLCPRFVSAISGMLRPMNQQCFGPIYMSGMEVGHAFNSAVEMILGNPVLSKFKYMLTCEDDNIPPPDGLLKLYESIGEYDCVAGLYWTKGIDHSQPMCYGNPDILPLNFVPQSIKQDQVQRCNGLGMGFNLWKMDVFSKLEKPWFETKQSWDPATGVKCYTQDLWFFEKMARAGMKVACDNRIKVGHYSIEEDVVY
jgi:hypothetical protein